MSIGGVGSYIGAMYRYAWERGFPLHRPKLIRIGGSGIPDRGRCLLEYRACLNLPRTKPTACKGAEGFQVIL